MSLEPIETPTDGLKEHFSFPHGAQRFKARTLLSSVVGSLLDSVLEGAGVEVNVEEVVELVVVNEVEAVVASVVVSIAVVDVGRAVLELTGMILHMFTSIGPTPDDGTTAT